MIYLNVRQNVTDYDQWRAAFDAHSSSRRAAGATGKRQIYRDVEDPNIVTLILEWDDAERAARFLEDPEMNEAMQKAGVVGAPVISTIQARIIG